MAQAGYNTFLLENKDVFLDMLTDSGVNAMSQNQQAAMLMADDAYAGSATYTRLYDQLVEIFGMEYFLPAHQGRAAENIISQVMIRPEVTSDHPFKGNLDVGALRGLIDERGADALSYVRMESGTNLVGGQPFSVQNLREVSEVCREHSIPLVLDASLLADNLYFNKVGEESCRDKSIREITREIADLCNVLYFSARKLDFGRGGGICIRDEELYKQMRGYVPMFEVFLTYGGMSVREMEAPDSPPAPTPDPTPHPPHPPGPPGSPPATSPCPPTAPVSGAPASTARPSRSSTPPSSAPSRVTPSPSPSPPPT